MRLTVIGRRDRLAVGSCCGDRRGRAGLGARRAARSAHRHRLLGARQHHRCGCRVGRIGFAVARRLRAIARSGRRSALPRCRSPDPHRRREAALGLSVVGRPPTPSCVSSTRCGRTSAATTWPRRSPISAGASAGLADWGRGTHWQVLGSYITPPNTPVAPAHHWPNWQRCRRRRCGRCPGDSRDRRWRGSGARSARPGKCRRRFP